MKDERELIPFIKKRLDRRYLVKTRVSLPRSKIDEAWKTWKGKIEDRFAQPDIDILYVHPARKRIMHAFEIKLFRKRGKLVNYPFYEGIGEALALLRFGIECVALWQFFEENVGAQEIAIRAGSAKNLIEKLELPIGYRCSVLNNAEGGPEECFQRKFLIDGPKNPFCRDPSARSIANYIRTNVFKML